jgi:hypothetical protein
MLRHSAVPVVPAFELRKIGCLSYTPNKEKTHKN